MQILASDEQWAKASDSIRKSAESGAKVISQSDSQNQKHLVQRISTDGGRRIVVSDEHSAKTSDSI
jgi:hypothetical protein